MKALRSSRSILARLLPLALLLLVASTAAAGPGKLSRDLQALEMIAGGDGLVDVIVTYRTTPTAAHAARLGRDGAGPVRELRLVNGSSATVPMNRLQELADDPDVVRISWDEPVAAATDVATVALGAWTAREMLGIDGAGVRVAVVDSGVEPVAGLGAGKPGDLGRIAAWVDLVEPHRRFPGDPYGHGTHVAGIIAGGLIEIHDPGKSPAVHGGVAPGAEIVSVRVLDEEGRGRTSDVIAGIAWVVDQAPALGIRVMNLSLGHPVRDLPEDDPLVRACESAWEAGLLVVTSAGNLGREPGALGTITSPGHSPRLLTVGALDDRDTVQRSDDTVATYSSRGPAPLDGAIKPDLLAPGDSIVSLRSPLSTLDRAFPENRVGSSARGAGEPPLFRLSGTSMAAAMVSGVAALLLAQDPDLTPDTLKARLMRSAEKRDEAIWARGAGAVDVLAAIADDGRAAGSLSPRARPAGAEVVMEGPLGWGNGWPAEELYGAEALWDLGAAWDLLQSPPPDAPLVWQVPPPDGPGQGIHWERAPGTSTHSVVWQLRGDSVVWQGNLNSQSVVWQRQVNSQSVVWQAESVVWQAESVVWQNQLSAESVVWQNQVSADSVVWQENGGATDILIRGDRNLTP